MQDLNEVPDPIQVTKPLSLFSILVDALGIYFNPKSEAYVKLLFENANTGYAEVRV